jgi:hypothetical protein
MKKNKELIKETENDNDPILKEVIEYESENGEEFIKDLSTKQLEIK